MNRPAIAAVLFLAATAVPVQAQELKAEDQVKQRKSGYAVIGHNFGSLGAMAQGKKPYNKEEAVRNAEMVSMLADYPKHFFGPGTDKGETKAKPEIWKNRSDFDDKMEAMIVEARKLPQAARGDLASLKKAVGDTGAKCKACHDDYRAK
jgi:cytochrome c556